MDPVPSLQTHCCQALSLMSLSCCLTPSSLATTQGAIEALAKKPWTRCIFELPSRCLCPVQGTLRNQGQYRSFHLGARTHNRTDCHDCNCPNCLSHIAESSNNLVYLC